MASLSSSSSSSSQRDLFTEVFTGELIRVLIEFLNIHVFDLGYTEVCPLRSTMRVDIRPEYSNVLTCPLDADEKKDIQIPHPGPTSQIISLDDDGLSCRRSLWGLNRSLRSYLDSPRFDKFSLDQLAYQQMINNPSFFSIMRDRSQLHRDEQEAGDYESRPLYNPSLPPHRHEVSCPLIKPGRFAGALERAWLEHSRQHCDSEETVIYRETLFKVHLLLLITTEKTKRWSTQQEGDDLWGNRCTLDILFHMSINKSIFKFCAGDTTTGMFLHTAVLVFYRIFGLKLTIDIICLLWMIAGYKGYIHTEGEIVGMNQMIKIFNTVDYHNENPLQVSFITWAGVSGILNTCWSEKWDALLSLDVLIPPGQVDSVYAVLSLQQYSYCGVDMIGWMFSPMGVYKKTLPLEFVIADLTHKQQRFVCFSLVCCRKCYSREYPSAHFGKYWDARYFRECPWCKTVAFCKPKDMDDGAGDNEGLGGICNPDLLEFFEKYKIDIYDGALGYWYDDRVHWFPCNRDSSHRYVKNSDGYFVAKPIELLTQKTLRRNRDSRDKKKKKRKRAAKAKEEETKDSEDGRMA